MSCFWGNVRQEISSHEWDSCGLEDFREKTHGPDHPEVAVSLGNKAGVYRKKGREKEAEGLERRAAGIRAMKR